MSKQTAKCADEFDEFVSQYNDGLAHLEDPKVQRRNMWGVFFRGMGSVLNIFGTSSSSINQFRYNLQLYSREGLTPEQRDAIALASDWQRVDRTLDEVLSGDSSNGDISVKDATQGKHLVRGMYKHFKGVYVTSAIK